MLGLRKAAAEMVFVPGVTGEAREVGGEPIRDVGWLLRYSGGVRYGVSFPLALEDSDTKLGEALETGGETASLSLLYETLGKSVATEGRGETDLRPANGSEGGMSGVELTLICWLISFAACALRLDSFISGLRSSTALGGLSVERDQDETKE